MARAQRNDRITICHYVWMANHLHMQIVMHDANDCKLFYAELQKRLTEFMKRLLGRKHLTLWEGRPTVAIIRDIKKAQDRIAYGYGNPSKADLEETIDAYPGLSSWEEFLKADSRDSVSVTEVPWVRIPRVPKVGSRSFSKEEDQQITEQISKRTRKTVTLTIKPNAWMKAFGLEEKDVAAINQTIVNDVRRREARERRRRRKEKKSVIGASALTSRAILKPHRPKAKERKIFVLASTKKLRITFIKHLKALCERCRVLFKQRTFDLWPPGMFRPPPGVLASAIAV